MDNRLFLELASPEKLRACVDLYLESIEGALLPLSALVWSSAKEKWNEHEEGIVIRCKATPSPPAALQQRTHMPPTVLLANARLH